MPDIGSTLRDTRIRKKIDIAQVEAEIKIRAKYLRALETEEFDVLPGPAYVKSFLRTYAEYLGLDATMLVDTYRARYETQIETEYPHFAEPPTFHARRTPRGRPPSRRAAVALLGGLLVVFLLVLGLTAKQGGGPDTAKRSAPGGQGKAKAAKPGRGKRKPAPAANGDGRSQATRVVVQAEQDVWACLLDASGRRRIDAATLAAGTRKGPFESRSFRATFGNGYLSLRVNGKVRTVRDTPNPVGLRITAAGLEPLSEAARPTCT